VTIFYLVIYLSFLLNHKAFAHQDLSFLSLFNSFYLDNSMAASSGSLDTSANSHPSFTFSTHPFMTTSFSDLLASGNDIDDPNTTNIENKHRGLSDRIADRTGSGVPKFKSIPPPSLPISPPAVSPSSYFAIPAGLSPAELLDSPVLLNSSNVCFLSQSFCFFACFVIKPFWFFEKFERDKG
jgi:hypothetical protein